MSASEVSEIDQPTSASCITSTPGAIGVPGFRRVQALRGVGVDLASSGSARSESFASGTSPGCSRAARPTPSHPRRRRCGDPPSFSRARAAPTAPTCFASSPSASAPSPPRTPPPTRVPSRSSPHAPDLSPTHAAERAREPARGPPALSPPVCPRTRRSTTWTTSLASRFPCALPAAASAVWIDYWYRSWRCARTSSRSRPGAPWRARRDPSWTSLAQRASMRRDRRSAAGLVVRPAHRRGDSKPFERPLRGPRSPHPGGYGGLAGRAARPRRPSCSPRRSARAARRRGYAMTRSYRVALRCGLRQLSSGF